MVILDQFFYKTRDMHTFILKLATFLSILGLSQAGFRCTFGDVGCTTGCVLLGQTSGICDDNGKCW